MFASPADIAKRGISPDFLRMLDRDYNAHSRALRQGKPHIYWRGPWHGYECVTEWGSRGIGLTPREAYRQAKGR